MKKKGENSPKFALRYTCNSDSQYLSSSNPSGTFPEYHFSILRSPNSTVSRFSFFFFAATFLAVVVVERAGVSDDDATNADEGAMGVVGIMGDAPTIPPAATNGGEGF